MDWLKQGHYDDHSRVSYLLSVLVSEETERLVVQCLGFAKTVAVQARTQLNLAHAARKLVEIRDCAELRQETVNKVLHIKLAMFATCQRGCFVN